MRTYLRFFCAVLFISAILPGCSTDPVVLDPGAFIRLYVIGVLSPATRGQEVYLSVSTPDGMPDAVDDARVWIAGPAGEGELHHVGDGVYRDVSEVLEVERAATYRLRVLLADGREIRSATTVPAGLHIVSPAQGDTVYGEPVGFRPNARLVRARWQGGTGGWVTEAMVAHRDARERAYPATNCFGLGDSADFVVDLDAAEEGGIVPLSLYCTYLDTAYSLWRIRRGGQCSGYLSGIPPSTEDLIDEVRGRYGDERINVEGAYGVFGSAVVESVTFYLQSGSE